MTITVTCRVNGQKQAWDVHPLARLLDVLREQGGFTGTKEGCGEGECGACSVMFNGELVNSCLIPALQVQGAEILTVEGLGTLKNLSVLQESFLKCGGAQCGICTPGMMMAAHALLEKNKNPTLEETREALGGNLCRCTGYTKILEAVCRATKGGEHEG